LSPRGLWSKVLKSGGSARDYMDLGLCVDFGLFDLMCGHRGDGLRMDTVFARNSFFTTQLRSLRGSTKLRIARLCERCQTCPPGFYANNSVSQAAVPCPDNGKSARGSDAIADCACIPGFYRSGDLCVICPLDSYCPRSVLQPVACPAQGRTFFEGSHCPHFMRAVTGRLPSCSKMPMSVRPPRLPLPARVLPRPADRREEL
jgi:hypothetical protein